MPIDSSVRVLVVDDHPGVRSGIVSLINAEQPRMHTVGAVGTAGEALAQARKRQPDVVVLDVNLDGENGLALIPALLDAATCRVVVLTSLTDPQIARHAQRLGALDCVHKTAPATELLASILRAHQSPVAPPTPAVPPANAGAVLSWQSGIKHP